MAHHLLQTMPAILSIRLPGLLTTVALLAACGHLPTTSPAGPAQLQGAKIGQAEDPSVVCSAKQGNPFAMRKKVLVLSLPAAHPEEAADLPEIASAWSQALQERLQHRDFFLIRDGSQYRIDPSGDVRQQVITLARTLDAQIVIAGQISSLGVVPERIGLGFLGSLPKPYSNRRVIETQLDIYDGDSGVHLARLDQHGEALGKVFNQDSPPMQGSFFNSSLGGAIAIMLGHQVLEIENELACLPLQARLTLIQGHEARVDAGFTSHIRPGDSLRVIQPQGFPGGQQIEKTFGNLVIKQVFPEAAIGQFQGTEQPDWRYSVFVRAW